MLALTWWAHWAGPNLQDQANHQPITLLHTDGLHGPTCLTVSTASQQGQVVKVAVNDPDEKEKGVGSLCSFFSFFFFAKGLLPVSELWLSPPELSL